MTARSDDPTGAPIPGNEEPEIPTLEDDQSAAPRPEEEIADQLRSEPAPDGRAHGED